MSLPQEDGVGSLCQKALRIVTELCFAGRVERETCAGIFPAERGGQGGGSTGERAPRPGPGRPPASRRRPQLREAGCRAPGPPSRGGRRAGGSGRADPGHRLGPRAQKVSGRGDARCHLSSVRQSRARRTDGFLGLCHRRQSPRAYRSPL